MMCKPQLVDYTNRIIDLWHTKYAIKTAIMSETEHRKPAEWISYINNARNRRFARINDAIKDSAEICWMRITL